MNKVILMGRLTKDPETRYSQGGSEALNITRYTLAVNRRFKREGEPDADFINCTAIGKSGEFAEKYFKKGMQVLVSGRLQIRSYDDPKTNQRNWYTEIILDDQHFTESKAAFEARVGNQGSSNYGDSAYNNSGGQPYQNQSPKPSLPANQPNDVPPDFFIDQELNDDDLPF